MKDLHWKGAATGVIYGFLQTILQLEERFQTDRILFCFDSHASKRRSIYPAYKINRKNRQPMTPEEEQFEQEYREQVQQLRNRYLPAIGFRNIYWQRGYESDDLIAYIAAALTSNKTEGIIISADHDLYQCITGHVQLYDFRSRMTLQRFKREIGLLPSQWAAVKAIAGCSTDNVEGVKGVGEKTAIKYLLSQLNSTSKAYRAIIAKRRLIQRNEKLVCLPLPGVHPLVLRKEHITQKGWDDVCETLGLKSLQGKLPRIFS
jgi:5'-3' exonuclease